MLNRSFIFAKGMTEEVERVLWSKGLTTWDLLRKHSGEAAEIMGQSRAHKLVAAVTEAQGAFERKDLAWFRTNWPDRELWRLWQGFSDLTRIALVDIETTGLTPGYDQITVIGLADGKQARVFVAGRPQTGDEVLEKLFKEGVLYAIIGIGSLKNLSKRQDIFNRLKKIGFHIPTIICSEAASIAAALTGGARRRGRRFRHRKYFGRIDDSCSTPMTR